MVSSISPSTNNTLLLEPSCSKSRFCNNQKKWYFYLWNAKAPNQWRMEWVIAWKTTHTAFEHFPLEVILWWTCRGSTGNYSKCGSFILTKSNWCSSFCIQMLQWCQKSTKVLSLIFWEGWCDLILVNWKYLQLKMNIFEVTKCLKDTVFPANLVILRQELVKNNNTKIPI